MTIALETIGDGSVADRNFLRLMTLVPDTGGVTLGVRIGKETASFTASKLSATVTVTHGLGTAPQNVQLTAIGAGAVPLSAFVISGSETDTQFQFKACTADGSSITSDADVYWEVKG